MARLILTFILSVTIVASVFCQNHNETRAINNYISFVNESIHGLLIAHRLFETYNQTINKYVDLPEYKLNNYSNADLPDNIFVDPEQSFYEISPYAWHDIVIRESRFLDSKATTINQHISEMRGLLKKINTKRLSIANLLVSSDLTQSTNLKKVYEELEHVVDLFDRFYEVYRTIDAHLNKSYSPTLKAGSYSVAFQDFYNTAKIELDKIRNKEKFTKSSFTKINGLLISLEQNGDDTFESQGKKRISTNTSRLLRGFEEFLNNKKIPIEYELYGNSYYYYNFTMLNRINKYGNGFVKEYNKMAESNGHQMATEIPQLYKVVYPQKLPKEELTQLNDSELIALLEKDIEPNHLPSPRKVEISNQNKAPEAKEEQNIVEDEPEIDRSRSVVVHQEKIYVKSDSFELELFDHLIKDGDRVSININGEWKFKRISLEKEPQTVTIHVRPGQKNYILIHADNTGYRPPNTVALAYMLDGERKEISLKTDLENSQMVEIQYVNN